MPRARSPDSIKAEALYREGKKLNEIAKQLGVPEGTVRRWKCTQEWEGKGKKKQSERSEKKKVAEKANVRKKGAPVGNQNAKGHGAPQGNKNALKHGAYSERFWDFLDGEEQDFDDMPEDEEILLLEEIKLASIRERRIMRTINKYRDIESGQYISGAMKAESKRSFHNTAEKKMYDERIREKVDKKERLPGEAYSQQTYTQATVDLVARLEQQLTTVQRQKTKAIEALANLRLERQRIAGETSGNEIAKTWAEKVLKARREQSGK